jgi:hypothetical protein
VVDINCDMGEGFGVWRITDNAAIMRHIDTVNVACGFHASDPLLMDRTVAMGVEAGINLGASRDLPGVTARAGADSDRVGFRYKGPALELVEREQPFGAGSDLSNIVDAHDVRRGDPR